MDLFGSPHLLAAHWQALIRSHLLEPRVAKGRPSATRVLQVVRRFAAARMHEAPGVGLGVERRVADDRMTGHALTLNGSIVHAVFFSRAAREAQPPRGRHGPAPRGDDGAR